MNCEYCGKEINGRKRRFCDRACLDKAKNARHKKAPEVKSATCAKCGVVFSYINKGKEHKYCSSRCRNTIKSKPTNTNPVCAQCGEAITDEQRIRSHAIYCSEKCKAARGHVAAKERLKANPKKLCLYCGGPVLRNGFDKRHKDGANNFCSHKCYAGYRTSSTPVCPECGRHHQGNESELCCDCKRKNEYAASLHKTCEICGADFIATNVQAKRCSDECSKEWKRREARRYDKLQERLPKKPRACKWCGDLFIPDYGTRMRSYCSVSCGDHAARAIRAATNRIRNAKTTIKNEHGLRCNPISVKRLWIRDGGRCALCGKPVDINLSRGGPSKRPDMMCATRDHIVPISHGGEHTWENVQLAHFMCNSKRGDKGAAQMLLFG